MYINVMFSYLKQLAWKQIIYFWTLWEWETNDLKRARGWCFSYICTHTYACARVRTNTHVYILTHTHTQGKRTGIFNRVVQHCRLLPPFSLPLFFLRKAWHTLKTTMKRGALVGLTGLLRNVLQNLTLYTNCASGQSISQWISSILQEGAKHKTVLWGRKKYLCLRPGSSNWLKTFYQTHLLFCASVIWVFSFQKNLLVFIYLDFPVRCSLLSRSHAF